MTEQEWTPEGADSLEAAVAMAVGAGSVCWENLNGTGEYQSNRAQEIVDGLLAWMAQDAKYRPTQEQKARLWAVKEAADMLRARNVVGSASVDWIDVVGMAEFLLATEPTQDEGAQS